MDVQTANANTNTNTFNQIGIINSDKTKQKLHNIRDRHDPVLPMNYLLPMFQIRHTQLPSE